MLRIKIYELEKHRNETTFRPLLFANKIIKYIGHEPESNFTRPLFDYEGVICIEK